MTDHNISIDESTLMEWLRVAISVTTFPAKVNPDFPARELLLSIAVMRVSSVPALQEMLLAKGPAGEQISAELALAARASEQLEEEVAFCKKLKTANKMLQQYATIEAKELADKFYAEEIKRDARVVTTRHWSLTKAQHREKHKKEFIARADRFYISQQKEEEGQ